MEYKKFECKSYNIHLIKTDKFKTVHLEVIFRNEYTKETLPMYTLLCDCMTDTTKNYPTRKEMAIRAEELYKLVFYGLNSKVGEQCLVTFVSEFIDPKYIKDKSYLEDIIKFIFNSINKPNATYEEFDLKTFNVCKKRLLADIDSLNENPEKMAIHNAIKYMDETSKTNYKTVGDRETVEKITPEKLYQAYLDLFNHFLCDIYIIGNVDEKIVELIKENFKNRVIKDKVLKIKVDNKERKKPVVKNETGNYNQSNLIMLYNIKGINDERSNMAFHVFNSVLCTSGITSILYQKLREERSLCYGVKSMYLKYDGILLIHVSLNKDNVSSARKLIDDAIKEMAKGELVSEEVLNNNIGNLKFMINSSRDNNVSILNSYVFNMIDETPLFDEKIELLESIKLKDIAMCASSLKLNTTYVLGPGDEL